MNGQTDVVKMTTTELFSKRTGFDSIFVSDVRPSVTFVDNMHLAVAACIAGANDVLKRVIQPVFRSIVNVLGFRIYFE